MGATLATVQTVKRARARILLVDDDQEWAALVTDVLVAEGYTVETAADGLDALERLPSYDPFLVVTDIQMPRMNGRQLLEKLVAYDERLPVIIMSGERLRVDAHLDRAFRVIEKLNAGRELMAAIAAAAEHRIARLPLQRLWNAAGGLRREIRRPRLVSARTGRWGLGLMVALGSAVVLVNRLRAPAA